MATAATTRRRVRAAASLVLASALLAACGDSAPQRDSAGAIDGPTETRLLELREGDCVQNMRLGIEKPDGGHNGVPKIVAVPCSQPHDGEILLIASIGDGDWPGAHIVDGEAARGRQGLTQRLARGEAAVGEDLTLFTFRPTQERWEFEDQHEIVFVALLPKPRRDALPR